MHPKPVERVSMNRLLKDIIDLSRNGFDRSPLSLIKQGNLLSILNMPLSGSFPVADGTDEPALIPLRHDGGCSAALAVLPEECQVQPRTGCLIRQQPHDRRTFSHEAAERFHVLASIKKLDP